MGRLREPSSAARTVADDVRRFEDALVDLIISVMYFLAFGCFGRFVKVVTEIPRA